MTIKELKEELDRFDDNDLVIISKDSEGNCYSPLSDIYTCAYQEDSSWSGEIGIRELTKEYIEAGYTEEDLLENGVNAVVLYPTN